MTGPIARSTRTPPSPYGERELMGLLNAQTARPHEFLLDVAVRHGDFVDLSLPFLPIYLLSRPAYAEHVLQTSASKYRKGAIADRMASLLGRGLLTSDGPFWLRQRRLVQPAFHKPRLPAMGDVILRAVDRLAIRWRDFAVRDEPIDVLSEMFRLALDVTLALTFGEEPDEDRDLLIESSLAIDQHLADDHGGGHTPSPHLAALDAAVFRQIDRRLRDRPDRRDILDLLLHARTRDGGEQMSPQEIRDELVTLIFAGHETTACLLGWTWCVLADHPDVDARLRADVQQALLGNSLSVDAVSRAREVTKVVREVLRLYPPVWNLSRTAEEVDEIDGYQIDAGSLVLVSPYVLHRHPALWQRPDDFDPERFADAAPYDRFAYLPFGAGPRVCIGDSLGLLEAQLVLAGVASRFRLTPVAPIPMTPVVTSTTLRPPSGALMHVTTVV
jgi:cytochrome P450